MQKKVVVEQVQNNVPEKKYRAGAISATVWLNRGQKQNGELSEYKSISIERNYTDKDGKWQSTNSLRVNDMPKARVVLQKAYEHCVLQE
ncbi:hypothetical protein HOL21_04265 [Candidatus Woesearchaeota archaeon]|jgi:hypothetical protein|nr:hypothetical protein [Candidatus Woesearchaeota archaeon]MBT5924731.1 hypothetical protein [Candidatus Woesearchaeota archaeon]MBT6367753.1 hypothetical protein [Candidatus Woesearchaeota archaeon]MBT7762801.1 hypothetical protein [Candidatus Woesearchaeota archaeon]